jgi:hypothetical protein
MIPQLARAFPVFSRPFPFFLSADTVVFSPPFSSNNPWTREWTQTTRTPRDPPCP